MFHSVEPEKFPDVDALSDTSFEMTKERVDSIRADLAPYMLRRTKDQVLNLPPLVRLFLASARENCTDL